MQKCIASSAGEEMNAQKACHVPVGFGIHGSIRQKNYIGQHKVITLQYVFGKICLRLVYIRA